MLGHVGGEDAFYDALFEGELLGGGEVFDEEVLLLEQEFDGLRGVVVFLN